MAFDPVLAREEHKAFLERYPIDVLHELTLEQYSNLNKTDSYTYFLEQKTEHAGSIWGGSSYKFGIYRKANTTKKDSRNKYLSDGTYAWAAKYGKTREEAWKRVHALIVEIAQLAKEGNFTAIDEIDMGHATRWKIAFMYHESGLLPIYKKDMLKDVAKGLNVELPKKSRTSEIQRKVFARKPDDQDVHEYSKYLLETYHFEIENESPMTLPTTSLNQILYGPPGTGKTYRSIADAVKIVNPNFNVPLTERKAWTDEYQRLVTDGSIVFTTFHQSLSYEDFVEGLKPKIDQEEEEKQDIEYKIKQGIFSELCEKAQGRYELENEEESPVDALGLQGVDLKEATIYKFSLGDVNDEQDHEIYEYCIENDCIALGYGGEVDYSNATTRKAVKDILVEATGDTAGLQAVHYFAGKFKQGDVVFISRGLSHIRAVGIIEGDYEYHDPSPIRYAHFRKVRWLKKDIDYPIIPLYGKRLSQSTTYAFTQSTILNKLKQSRRGPLNHVLIIDEINRGNVSRIFGELITLLEPDKRLGEDEALTVTLPYSRDTFGVPPNLYLIGTMNTADRSVVALDSALRRRFRFMEVAPDSSVIEKVLGTSEVKVNGEPYPLDKIMDLINARIEFLRDRDHLIGHSYFLKMTSAERVAEQFTTGIIPLLREYFYEDYGQLRLILGDGFINEQKGTSIRFPSGIKDNDLGVNEYKKYTVNDLRGNETGLAVALDILLNKPKKES